MGQRHVIMYYVRQVKKEHPVVITILTDIIDALVQWRSRHLSRSKNYLRRASTAGLSGGEYRDVYAVFSTEMKELINATKERKAEFKGQKEKKQSSIVSGDKK